MTPEFSIITPSFNQGQYLEETILSVLSQKNVSFEYIIIDGGSTDSSVEIINKYVHQLSYWVIEKDSGQADAINKGLKKSTGEFIMWLNSDDVLLPGALENAIATFRANPEAIMIHGKSTLFGKGIKNQIIGSPKKNLEDRYLAYIPFPQPASFFRKKLIEKTGLLNEDLHFGMDHDLLIRACLFGKVVYSDHLYSKYRLHESSKTHDHLKFTKDWNTNFSRLLMTFPTESKAIVSLFKEIDMFDENWGSTYNYTFSINQNQLLRSAFYHLFIRLHYYYNDLNLIKVREIADALKKLNPDLYREEHVERIRFKSSFPKSILSLARRFTR